MHTFVVTLAGCSHMKSMRLFKEEHNLVKQISCTMWHRPDAPVLLPVLFLAVWHIKMLLCNRLLLIPKVMVPFWAWILWERQSGMGVSLLSFLSMEAYGL